MQNEKVTFCNDEGRALSGLVALPDSAPRAGGHALADS